MKSGILALLAMTAVGCMPSGGELSEAQLEDGEGGARTIALWTPGVDGPLDVVVVLDSDRRFSTAARRVSRLVRDGWIPPAAVVGVSVDAPNEALALPPEGGVAEEHTFVTETVLPWLDDEVGAEGRRVLAGHGMGGLATVWSALQEPVAFDGFVAVSPALYESEAAIFDVEEARGQTGGDLPARVYLAAGGRERWGAGGRLLALTERLMTRPYPSMLLGFEIIEGRSEDTVFGAALDLGVTFALGESEGVP